MRAERKLKQKLANEAREKGQLARLLAKYGEKGV